jgi:predicted nucleic acid-binding protein
LILVDTSVWIEHLRKGVPGLMDLLEAGLVQMHPFVLGEIACGNLRRRGEVLTLLGDLPEAPIASNREAIAFIEARHLMGRGIGYVDVHLLASVVLAGTARLWTREARLAATASQLKCAYTS